ncbi:uncharacterized protein Dsimw501_GD29589, isoform B [Drosophila simulans]|nr:uncharacterized protein Dsimw501_GD29589, isoform B [Drosophila simulans]
MSAVEGNFLKYSVFQSFMKLLQDIPLVRRNAASPLLTSQLTKSTSYGISRHLIHSVLDFPIVQIRGAH